MVNRKSTWMLVIALCSASQTGLAQGQVVNMKSNPNLKIATFHSLWIFTGFSDRRIINSNVNQLAQVIKSFNVDFKELAPEVPKGLQVVTAPPIEKVLDEPRVTRAQIQSALRELEGDVTADGVIFVYVMTHGREAPDGLKLQFADGEVDRASFVKQIDAIRRARRARLAVVVTDNCSVATHAGTAIEPEEGREASIWRALYFGHHGLVDLNSTGSGEVGFIVGGVSVFTQAFRLALNLESRPETKAMIAPQPGDTPERVAKREIAAKARFVDLLDRPPKDGIVSWTEFEDHLRTQMKTVFPGARDSLKASDPAMYTKMNVQGNQSIRLFEAGAVGQPLTIPRR